MGNPAPKLKPCPFCGKPASFREYANGHKGGGEFTAFYEVGCKSCDVFIRRMSKFTLQNGYPLFEVNGFEEAVNLWNTRNGKEEIKHGMAE